MIHVNLSLSICLEVPGVKFLLDYLIAKEGHSLPSQEEENSLEFKF